jgi:hypothetical protein
LYCYCWLFVLISILCSVAWLSHKLNNAVFGASSYQHQSCGSFATADQSSIGFGVAVCWSLVVVVLVVVLVVDVVVVVHCSTAAAMSLRTAGADHNASLAVLTACAEAHSRAECFANTRN